MKKVKEFDSDIANRLRWYLTKGAVEFKDGIIGFHPDIDEKITIRILNNVDILEGVIATYPDMDVNYHSKSSQECYFLSSLFCFMDSKCYLNQGIFKFSDKPYYHSWIEIGDYIYDPAFNFVTLKSLYYEYFLCKYRYTRDELINLYRRVGGFTYYEEDLEYGIINPKGNIEYDTDEALDRANKSLKKLRNFLNQKAI